MKRRQLLKHLGAVIPAVALSPYARAADALTHTGTGTIVAGPFAPTWDSLSSYETPDWFRNAKFGIWAHWGAQCEPEHGDWYARGMYEEGSAHYRYHVAKYKDVIGDWSRAARANGMRFGVSVHAARTWTWFEDAQRADKSGPYAGIPYDGNPTRADGKGTWWEGMDPQALYAQNHALGAAIPDQAYCDKFFNRTRELIDNYDPDILYYDDAVLPLFPFSDVGMRLTAHLYNRSIASKGRNEAVVNGKILNAQQRRSMVWDIERGQSHRIEPLPWQTCTCIGSWHYDRPLYERKGYKSAQTVVHTLIDVVSKNGNLLLSVPVRGNGTIDEQERSSWAGRQRAR
ncbi:hypothetical protein RugamoR57_21430 [Duganella caerulea]|uniref:alpha-L-fucosidase n=1 Tax=Duganella caerulea TaxID=2885762 RepID=UPI0030EAA135